MSDYEIVIVGGRPAGASLAARLGAAGVETLIIDKARFPSLPAVPSCAVIYPQTLALLDEIGVDERLFADESALIRRLIIEVEGEFQAQMRMIEAHGRDYLYGIDRARFDGAVWETLGRHASVTASEGVSFVDLLREQGGRVIGVIVRDRAGAQRSIRAKLVVGADGRFSPVARKAGARVVEEFAERTSTVHYASWAGVPPSDGDPQPTAHIYTIARGANALLFPNPEHRTLVCTHLRSDRVQLGGDATRFYLETLERFPSLWRRLQGAQRLSAVVGMRRVSNRYREAGGPGWVLVGDALHHKDPVDSQGIYDALLESKLLAQALLAWRAGEHSWAEALARYERQVHEQTHGMFLATMERLRRELYVEPPRWLIKTVLRWMLTDEEYKRRFLRFLCRSVPPDDWAKHGLIGRAVLRGLKADLRRWFTTGC